MFLVDSFFFLLISLVHTYEIPFESSYILVDPMCSFLFVRCVYRKDYVHLRGVHLV